MSSFDPLYLKGIEHFNKHEFFECHEVLEELWFKEQGASKRYYQGLIQLAVALYHYENGNYRGALKLLRDGVNKLRKYSPSYLGLDLGNLVPRLEQWITELDWAVRKGSNEGLHLEIPALDIRQ